MSLPLAMNFSERVRARGVAGAKETLTIAPNNGPTFNCGTGMIQFEIPGNQMAKYADFSSLYIACDITNSDPATANAFSHIGTMGLVSRVVVMTNTNKQFCDISYKNQLDAMMIAKGGDANWLTTSGNVMFGTSDNTVAGESFAAAATLRFLIPLSMIGIDLMMFPLSSMEKLRFQIYLEAAGTAFKQLQQAFLTLKLHSLTSCCIMTLSN